MELFTVTIFGLDEAGSEHSYAFDVVSRLGSSKAVAVATQAYLEESARPPIFRLEVAHRGFIEQDDRGQFVTPGNEVFDWREFE